MGFGTRMTLAEFSGLASVDKLAALSPLLRALWHDARGEWDKAHALAQEVDDRDGAWVHAYLHRKEGDLGNAAYWYGRAEQPVAADSLEAEWKRIAEALLNRRA
jgi:hypothetical protein